MDETLSITISNVGLPYDEIDISMDEMTYKNLKRACLIIEFLMRTYDINIAFIHWPENQFGINLRDSRDFCDAELILNLSTSDSDFAWFSAYSNKKNLPLYDVIRVIFCEHRVKITR